MPDWCVGHESRGMLTVRSLTGPVVMNVGHGDQAADGGEGAGDSG